MSEVFADSHYFIALLNRRDRSHADAIAASRRRGLRLVTTHWVLIEVADALRDPAIRQTTEHLVRSIPAQHNFVLVTDLEQWFHAGLELYRLRPDKSWSLTDCISFAVMQARGIREALTGDHHFEQAGFVPLLPSPKS